MGDHEQVELHDKDVDWWCNESAGDMGCTGTSGGLVQLQELGTSVRSSGGDPDHMTDRQLRTVTRYRRVESAWLRLDGDTRRILRCYYEHRQFPLGVRVELGRLAGVVMAPAITSNADRAKAAQAAGYLRPDPTVLVEVNGEMVRPKQTQDLSDRAKAVLASLRKTAHALVAEAHAKLDLARLAEEEDRAAADEDKRVAKYVARNGVVRA